MSAPFRFVFALALMIAAFTPSPVWAWGFEAHRMIASLAEQQLTPPARKEVQALLALEPGSTMESVSTWADETRSRSTASWHYVNLPKGECTYAKERDCPDGSCVVEAITAQLAILKSKAPANERLVALKYIVHLVGDIHQPLHAGYAFDKGGNLFQLQAFGKGANLHGLWDSGLVANWPGGPAALKDEIATTLKAPAASSALPAPNTWAEESCRVVSMPGFYPDGHIVGQEYLVAHGATLKNQLASAAVRLASLLNQALGER